MISKIKNFFIGSYEEFRKVIWPSRKEVISHTIIVLVSIAISMGIIALVDYGLFSLVQKLIINRGA
jgi:preprotein translocase subunit SecE